ncbi:MAG: HNH endonuclease [Rhodobacteraceae bacterium]|nr:HNH endonuclease [Paracoccaceae bacterium]
MVLRLCGYAGCQEYATDRTRCVEHAVERDAKEAERKAKIDMNRKGGAFRRLYNGKQWRAASKNQLRNNPLCAECETFGLVTSASVVDHIESHRHASLKLFWDRHNWQSLCIPCHNRKTAREVGFAGRH